MVVDAEDKIASELAADAQAVLALAGQTQGSTAPAWEKLLQAAQEVLQPPAVPSLLVVASTVRVRFLPEMA